MMRKRYVTALAFGTLVVLAGCVTRPPKPLESGEVIRRAVIAAQTLESVSFDADIGMRASSFSGTVLVYGILHNETRTWSANADINVERMGRALTGRLWFSSPVPHSLFIRADGNSAFPALSQGSGSTAHWWRVAMMTGASLEPKTAPDPAVIDAYARAIHVESGGLEKGADGRYVYRFQVKMASGAALLPYGGELPVADGMMLIDADSFRLLEVRWHLPSVPSFGIDIACDVHVRLHDHDRAPRIELPTGAAQDLSLDTIFAMFSAY